jgi:hypothetical protein
MPALATISSCEASTPETPMPPMILPSMMMGRPPCNGVTPGTAKMRKALPLAAKLSSKALVGAAEIDRSAGFAGGDVDAGVLRVQALQHN